MSAKAEQHHQTIPHLENPFEEKALEQANGENLESGMEDGSESNIAPENRGPKDWASTEASFSPRTPSNTLENNPDEINEDELNYVSRLQLDPDAPSMDDPDNSETKIDVEPEEYGLKRTGDGGRHWRSATAQTGGDGAHHLAKEIAAAPLKTQEARSAMDRRVKPNVIIDEEAVQDALIQAAEDAMRYAYEESARRQAAGSSSFEQHQLAEILVRQRQSLMRLEELDDRMQSLETHLDRVVGHMLTSISATASSSSSSSPESPGTMGPKSLFERMQWAVMNPKQVLPQAVQATLGARSRMRQVLASVGNQIQKSMHGLSWNQVSHGAWATVREIVFRIDSRVRQLLGVQLPQDQQGLRHVYEGLEDRMILAGVVSGILTFWALLRLRRYHLGQHQRLVKGLAPHTVPGTTSTRRPVLAVT